MNIMYGRTAFVHEVDPDIYYSIEKNIASWADGANNVCITIEDLISHIDEYKERCEKEPKELSPNDHKLGQFMIELRTKLKGEIGDIIFSKE